MSIIKNTNETFTQTKDRLLSDPKLVGMFVIGPAGFFRVKNNFKEIGCQECNTNREARYYNLVRNDYCCVNCASYDAPETLIFRVFTEMEEEVLTTLKPSITFHNSFF